MSTSRTAVRSLRALRAAKLQPLRQCRFQSSSSNASSQSHGTTALYGGLAGGALAAVLGYTWYSFSGVKTAVSTAHQVKSYYDTSKQRLQQAAPEPNEALEWLRKQTSFYAGFVPGGRQYVDTAFADLDTIREKHGGEVDQIVKDAYNELKGIASQDLSVSSASDAWEILQKYVKRIGDLASDSAHEILANHPELKSAVGDNVDQLRKLGGSLGPEANKIVTDTWSQISGLVASGGIGAASISKVKKLIEEKIEQVKKLGDKAWGQGLDELKPYLDKNPQIKELLDSNKQELISKGTELWSKTKEASQSGNTEALEQYVKQVVDKAKEKGGDTLPLIEKYIDQVLPGGAKQLLPKFDQFKELVQKGDTKGLENLIKDTVNEIEQLLEKKIEEGKKLLNDKESK